MIVRRLVVALVAALTVLLVPATAQAAPGSPGTIPECTDISSPGASGQINIRTSPLRNVAWNIAMYDPSRHDGPWTVDVYVNNRRDDHKQQDHQPHGGINAGRIPENSFISIEAYHLDLKGTEHVFVPDQRLVR